MSCNPCSLGRCPDPKDYNTHDPAPYARSTNGLTSELRIRKDQRGMKPEINSGILINDVIINLTKKTYPYRLKRTIA